MFGLFRRIGCFGCAIASVFPVIVLCLVLLLVGAMAGVLPQPLAGAGAALESAVGRAVITASLSDSVSIDTLDVRNIGDATPPNTNIYIVVRENARPLEGVSPFSLRIVRAISDRIGTFFFPLADHVDQVTLTILPVTGQKPVLRAVITRASINAWRSGGLSDAAFLKTWKIAK